MANVSISQLDSAVAVNNGDLFETAQPDLNSASGYASAKQSLAAIADHIATQVNYPGLNTTSKSIVGAINEAAQGGGGGSSANENIASAYSSSSTYAVDDLVIYNNVLYKCVTAISTPEAFNAAHWQSTTIASYGFAKVHYKVVSGTLDSNCYLDGTGLALTDAVLGVVAYDPSTNQHILGSGAMVFAFANVALGSQTLRFLTWNFGTQYAGEYIKCTVAYVPTSP